MHIDPTVSLKIAFQEYVSPDGETSIVKNIPMRFRNDPLIKEVTRMGFVIRYRGPRGKHWRERYSTRKDNATGFTVYPPSRCR